LRERGAQVVADTTLVLEELRGDHCADRVAAQVLETGATAPVPVEAGDRVGAAGHKLSTQNIAIGHRTSIPRRHCCFRVRLSHKAILERPVGDSCRIVTPADRAFDNMGLMGGDPRRSALTAAMAIDLPPSR
jgi:hypothetical protein